MPARKADELLADWLETRLLVTHARAIGIEQARQLLVEKMATSDASAGMALNAMARRRAILGERYPWRIGEVGIERAEADATCYELLLVFSTSGTKFRSTPGAFAEASVLFEDLVCDALRALLGQNSVAIRFGWPTAEGRPREFAPAIVWLANRMGSKLGRAYRPPRRKDGGVDVVAWRPFGDSKPGFPLLLVQCTLERDFVHKSRDVDRRIWGGWLAFDADPMTALAIPHAVASIEDWHEMASNVIVLDRVRLASLLGPQQYSPGAMTWLADQLAQFAAVSDDGE